MQAYERGIIAWANEQASLLRVGRFGLGEVSANGQIAPLRLFFF